MIWYLLIGFVSGFVVALLLVKEPPVGIAKRHYYGRGYQPALPPENPNPPEGVTGRSVPRKEE